jgi:outer membrane lipoprotein-sorting protein
MRRRWVGVLLSGLAFVAAMRVSAQTVPSVDDLVAKNLQSKGGIEKLKSIQSIKQTSRISMPQGGPETIVVYSKRPNLVRQEIAVAGKQVVMAYDGKTPWGINPIVGVTTPFVVMGPQADAIKQQSDFDGPLLDYKAHGYRLELVGLETVSGRQLQHLRLIDTKGQVQHYYLDPETALEARITFATDTGEFEQELSDYRDVDGLKVPFSIKFLANGVQQSVVTVQKVELNPKLDDAMFRMPK